MTARLLKSRQEQGKVHAMKENLQTSFSTRQYMLAKDFEIYYYNGLNRLKVESHVHDYYEFYLFLEGDVSIEIQKELYPLKQGDVVLIPPGVSHRAVIHRRELPYRRFVFWISRAYCNKLMEASKSYGYIMQQAALRNRYIFHNDVITFNTIQSKVFRLIEEIHSDRFGKEARVPLCVNDLILHLNRIAYEKEHVGSVKEEQKIYKSLIHFIEENLEEDLSLERLAGSFYLSKYHISHVFKENTGLSVHQYIIKKRLNACREAMLGDMDIGKAYLMYGFKDYSSFYRAFKKEYGMSPKEYKEMQGIVFENSF